MFLLVTPWVGPVSTPGASYEKVDRGPQGDATYQKQIFQFQRKKNEVGFCPYAPPCDSQCGASFNPRSIRSKTDRGPQGDARYKISCFREEEF